MKNLITSTAIILIIGNVASAQAPNKVWEKTFIGSSASSSSSFHAVKSTSDGGCIAVGKGKGSGGDLPSGYIDKGDALIVKTSSNGTVEWSDYWGQQEEDNAMSVFQTSDGGFVIAGYTAHMGSGLNLGGIDGFVVKYDASGSLVWGKNYGGSGNDLIYDIKQTSDGGYIFVGTTYSSEVSGYHGGSDVWIVKLNSAGVVTWSSAKGYSDYESAKSVAIASDGSYFITGSTNSPEATNHKGANDAWVLRINTNGTIAWQNSIGGTDDDGGSQVIQGADGSVWVAGRTKSNDKDISGNHSNGKQDLLLAHLDASGTLLTTKVYGGTENEATGYTDEQNIMQTSDGGFIMLTSTNSNNGDVDGNHGSYDFWLLKVNASGTLLWQKCIGTAIQDYAFSLDLSSDGGYLMAGIGDGTKAFLAKYKNGTSGIDDIKEAGVTVFPNPMNDYINIQSERMIQSIDFIDIMGREFNNIKIQNTHQKVDVTHLVPGSYLIRFNFANGEKASTRLIKN
ncbi:MAG TPA: T9SS type A sorting domain-containing protein [Edaphocola sp.]|nr:T9SS type A sorting domain-containing protein [Edaphocola sp.]